MRTENAENGKSVTAPAAPACFLVAPLPFAGGTEAKFYTFPFFLVLCAGRVSIAQMYAVLLHRSRFTEKSALITPLGDSPFIRHEESRMSIIDSLTSIVRGKVRHAPSRRRRAASCRSLRVEFLETRRPLSADLEMLALAPADDTVTLADDAAAEEPFADVQTDADLAGDISAKLEPPAVDELAVPNPDPAAVSELLAAGDATLSGSAAADALLVCWPVELDADPSSAADLDTQESFIDGLMIDDIVEANPTVTSAEPFGVSSDSGLEGVSGDESLTGSEDELQTGVDVALQTEAVSDPLLSGTINASSLSGTTDASSLYGTMNASSLYGPGDLGTIGLLPPPVVTAFSAVTVMNNVWYISGSVQYSVPSILTVTLGGLVVTQISVQPNGTFFFSTMLPEGINGIVSAQASVSGIAVTSNVAVTLIT